MNKKSQIFERTQIPKYDNVRRRKIINNINLKYFFHLHLSVIADGFELNNKYLGLQLVELGLLAFHVLRVQLLVFLQPGEI